MLVIVNTRCICFLYHTEKWSQLFYETHTEGIIGDIWDACIVAALIGKRGSFCQCQSIQDLLCVAMEFLYQVIRLVCIF